MLGVLLASAGFGQSDAGLARAGGVAAGSATAQAPVTMRVGVYLLEVGRLDTTTGNYTMDFYLTFQCDQPCDAPSFEFMNGRATNLDKTDDEPTRKVYRVQATLNENIDLRDYPFNRHTLTVIIEGKADTTDTLVFRADPAASGIDESVRVLGWILSPRWEAAVDTHFYPAFNETYSRYTFDIDIRRSLLTGILKGLLPALVIMTLAFIGFVFTDSSRLGSRLGIHTSAFTGSFLYHLSLTSSIPPVGYLTYADSFMIVNHITLTCALISTVLAMVLTDKGREERAQRFDRRLALATIAFWVGMQLSIGVFTYHTHADANVAGRAAGSIVHASAARAVGREAKVRRPGLLLIAALPRRRAMW